MRIRLLVRSNGLRPRTTGAHITQTGDGVSKRLADVLQNCNTRFCRGGWFPVGRVLTRQGFEIHCRTGGGDTLLRGSRLREPPPAAHPAPSAPPHRVRAAVRPTYAYWSRCCVLYFCTASIRLYSVVRAMPSNFAASLTLPCASSIALSI